MLPFAEFILESKSMGVIFQKRAKYLKFAQKCTKFENILENGR